MPWWIRTTYQWKHFCRSRCLPSEGKLLWTRKFCRRQTSFGKEFFLVLSLLAGPLGHLFQCHQLRVQAFWWNLGRAIHFTFERQRSLAGWCLALVLNLLAYWRLRFLKFNYFYRIYVLLEEKKCLKYSNHKIKNYFYRFYVLFIDNSIDFYY